MINSNVNMKVGQSELQATFSIDSLPKIRSKSLRNSL